eukprot:scaffold132361_cov69-Phaeocystis_antarctica.AAC.2
MPPPPPPLVARRAMSRAASGDEMHLVLRPRSRALISPAPHALCTAASERQSHLSKLSSPGKGATRRRSARPKFAMARATAPMFTSRCGLTSTTQGAPRTAPSSGDLDCCVVSLGVQPRCGESAAHIVLRTR